jgi:hypothetical protein
MDWVRGAAKKGRTNEEGKEKSIFVFLLEDGKKSCWKVVQGVVSVRGMRAWEKSVGPSLCICVRMYVNETLRSKPFPDYLTLNDDPSIRQKIIYSY